MKTDKNILIAFILNLAFSVFEFFGGIYTGSVAIISDALHDMGDAASIGFSLFLEKKSNNQPDKTYTYGYRRYSVLGGLITTLILAAGSVIVIYGAVKRIIYPEKIRYDGMIVFAVIGVFVNFFAAFFTRNGSSLNQKAVNLHMLEDVLGWAVVLLGAVIMKFTDLAVIDPVMSLGVAVFILINAVRNLKEILDIFLEKIPENIDIEQIKKHICRIDGVCDIHHIHIRSLDGQSVYATMHVTVKTYSAEIKKKIREELIEHGICHATLELETEEENCDDINCHFNTAVNPHGHHHHHHHH